MNDCRITDTRDDAENSHWDVLPELSTKEARQLEKEEAQTNFDAVINGDTSICDSLGAEAWGLEEQAIINQVRLTIVKARRMTITNQDKIVLANILLSKSIKYLEA